jgi:hypothetical protein
MHARAIDRLREAACLSHTVPGTTLRLLMGADRNLLVSRHCLGADLDPCQFRAAMLTRAGEHLAATVTRVELVAGLVDLGGGIYARTVEHRLDERWFVTALHHGHVVEVMRGCTIEDPDADHLEVVVTPDLELGLCAVRLAAPQRNDVLDEVALWAMAACLADELVADVAAGQMR